MSTFKIQHAESGLFWSSDDSIVTLDPVGSTYEIEGRDHIRNVDTGLCVRHSGHVLAETGPGGPDYDFEWTFCEDGTIHNAYDGGHFITFHGDHLRISKGQGAKWAVVHEQDEDVPVSRAAALIEQALNARASEPAPEVSEPAPEVSEPAPEVAP